MNSKTVIVMVPKSDGTIVNPAWAESLVDAQHRAWQKMGVSEDRMEDLISGFRKLVLKGMDPRYAAREMLMAVEEVLSDTHWTSLIKPLANQFRLSHETASELIAQARAHHHKNARPEYQQAISPVYSVIKEASRQAYLARASRRSTMAAAMIAAGVVGGEQASV